MRRSLLASLFFVLGGCGASTLPPVAAGPVTWEHDVRPIVEARCQACHVAGGIAPFALGSYEDVVAMVAPVRAAVESRRMPPWLAARGCADYQYDQSLTDEQIALIGTWVDQGTLRGDPATATQSVDQAPPGLTRVDLTLAMPERYTPTTSPDDYRCFVVDWPQPADTFVTGLKVVPGNPKVVHHVIAFVAAPDKVAAIEQLDAADPGPGYQCFGGPGGGIRAWLGAWAPGGVGSMYPAGTGLQVQAGSKVVLQVHYNLQNGLPGDVSDLTHVELALADTVEKRAVILPWTNPDWVKGNGMDIPAFAADVSHAFAYDPTPYLGIITGGALPSNVALRVHSASLHEHLLGSSGRIEILHDNRPNECLLDVPRWDFHWQHAYGFTQPKILRPNDRLAITCHWNNSAEAQPLVGGARATPHDVKWGEGTGDEMCLGILYVSQ
jgi:hypothetical protein